MDERIQEIMKPVFNLQAAFTEANNTLRVSASVVKHLSRMLDIAMDKMIAIADDEATPIKIRAELVVTLQEIRAIGFPTGTRDGKP